MVLLKGIAKKLLVPFSLAEKWGPGCALTIDASSEPVLPLWGKEVAASLTLSKGGTMTDKICFQQVAGLLKKWGEGKGSRFLERVVKRLPQNLKTKVLDAEFRRHERKSTTRKM
jgi:hypothetical protein